ncbi:hypothetical protein GPECTOR_3g60 [Gonium pectorale]|uniref:EF-hand domain-containing protein n=1 Tax=Gonium pectorale TaxID=33097 RepID=A0A150GZX0_GONPE|nr:hypothetical protein GPECTOR_3g60 [Gonium pectorale]|eukprot:KXZ55409.1 hypothetical protein GPECTOR_3g60 [Gonium pectorale]
MAAEAKPLAPAGPSGDASTALKAGKDLSQVNADLYTTVSLWLRKHGKGVKPKLTDDQKQQLKECFELMDQDGSGAIDAEELGAAFKLLGIRMKRAELAALLAEVDHDGSGEVEYPEFLEIMTVTLQRLAEEEDTEKNEGQVPFALMATAYRRKRLMEGIINGDKEVQAQIQQISDKANLEALQASKAAEVEALRMKAAGEPSALAAAAAAAAAGVAQPGRTPSGRPLRRIGQVDVNKALLDTLGPEERRIVSSLAAKVPVGGPRPTVAPPMPLSVANPRLYGHFANSPSHRQLIDTPQLLDLRFMHQSTIRLPPGANGPVRSLSGLTAGPTGPGLGVLGGPREGSPSASGNGVPPIGVGPAARRGSLPKRGGSPSAAPGAPATWGPTIVSPGRQARAEDSLPQLRYEGGAVAYPAPKAPMGVRLGTHAAGTRGS